MKHVNDDLLRSFHGAGKCEFCGKPCKEREPNHLWGRGFGGGCRLDVRINLIALGHTETRQCSCHRDYHDHKIGIAKMTEKVAAREREDADDITSVIWCIQAMPPRISAARQERFMADWPLCHSAMVLCVRTLLEIAS